MSAKPEFYRSMTAAAFAAAIWLAALVMAQAQEIDPAREYHKCMDLAKTAPEQGFDAALEWKGLGGGDAAEHCTAVALFGMGQYAQAAQRLQDLAQIVRTGAALKAQLLGQAGQAWLLAAEAEKAEQALTAAIELAPGDPELFIDRAQALAARGGYSAALEDLGKAIALDPTRVDAFVFRASAYRKLEQLAEAASDVDQALALRPGQPDALLERGMVRRLRGEIDGARKDWLAVIQNAPGTRAADLAQSNLQRLEETKDNGN